MTGAHHLHELPRLNAGDMPSVWRLEHGDLPDFPPLAGTAETDVLVIGGGFTGLSCALELAVNGARPMLVEAGPIAWGASARNGGHACTGFAPGQAGLERALGREAARDLFDLAESGKRLIATLQRRHGFDVHYRPGYLTCAATPRHVRVLEEDLAELERLGHGGCRLLEAEELHRNWLGTDAYHGALLDPHAGLLNPVDLCAGMARAAAGKGARIHAHTPALMLEEMNGGIAVRTPGGEITARRVVLAANAQNGALWPELAPYLIPVRACQVATTPLADILARTVIKADVAAVTDTRLPPAYFGLTPGRRLIFGAGASYLDRPPLHVTPGIHPHLKRTFPQLSDVPIDAAWCGVMAVTANRYPHCGRAGRSGDIWFAHGYSGQGVVLATLLGHLVARALLGDTERFELFAAIPHGPHPGGPLRAWLHAARMAWRMIRRQPD